MVALSSQASMVDIIWLILKRRTLFDSYFLSFLPSLLLSSVRCKTASRRNGSKVLPTESRYRQSINACLSPSSNHNISITKLNHPGSISNRMCPGSTGCYCSMVWSLDSRSKLGYTKLFLVSWKVVIQPQSLCITSILEFSTNWTFIFSTSISWTSYFSIIIPYISQMAKDSLEFDMLFKNPNAYLKSIFHAHMARSHVY